MKVTIPQSDMHNQVKMTFRSETWEATTTVDDSHRTVEMSLPKEVNEDDVEVIAEFLNVHNVPDARMSAICVKERIVKPKVEVKKDPPKKPEPKPEPKPEVKPEPAAEITKE